MSNIFPKQRFVVIFPVLATVLIFASVAGIIGNSILLPDTAVTRSFNIDNLEIGEVDGKRITLPSEFTNPEINVILTNTDFSDFGDLSLKITVYLADESIPTDIDTQTQLVDSQYYQNEVFDKSEEISSSDRFYLNFSPDTLYLVFANEGDILTSFVVTIVITSTGDYGVLNSTRILGIVFSSLLTLAFLGASIYLWLEIFEQIPVRFMNQSLDDRIDELQTKALTWEVVVVIGATIFLIFGYSQLLLGSDSTNVMLAILAYVLVYYNYNKRTKLEQNILRIITLDKRISLPQLAQRVNESENLVKKTLLDAIMYSDFPADYDFVSNEVEYNATGKSKTQVKIEEDEPVQEASFHVASTEVKSRVIEEEGEIPSRTLPKCAYCDEEAINVNAQFCHSCGASMSSAK